jgi:hypothetical protein
MILDERSEFADATALDTQGTGKVLIGDVMNLGAAKQNLGVGEPLYWVVEVTTAITSGGGPVVYFHLASDAQAAIAVDGSASIHATTPGTLVAGKTFITPIPAGLDMEQYLGVIQDNDVALTAGAINSFLTHDVSQWRAYADAL